MSACLGLGMWTSPDVTWLQVGDAIIYKDMLHNVKNFGLLSTQFVRSDGCKLWVRT